MKTLLNYLKSKNYILYSLVLVLSFTACKQSATKSETTSVAGKKIGVLLVNHCSRSATWRKALMDFEDTVRDSIIAGAKVSGVKTAYMEYNEPSIATRLKEFDKEAYSDVIIIPIFLTVSPHSFEDIPTIIGQKEDPESMEMLKIEKIERYTPKAKTHITPLLDFTDILQKNVLRRAQALSKNGANEGLVLIGYGDETYDKEWGELFDKVAAFVKQNIGISEHSYGWCGHIANYNPDETTKAINKVLSKKSAAVVIPVLVAHDEMFQVKIIGGGIQKVPNYKEKVFYKPDAILPDPNITSWVIAVSQEYANKIQ